MKLKLLRARVMQRAIDLDHELMEFYSAGFRGRVTDKREQWRAKYERHQLAKSYYHILFNGG